MTKTLDFSTDHRLLDFPKTASVRQKSTGKLNSYSFVQTGAVSIREAAASAGAYRVGDRKFYLPMVDRKSESGGLFTPGIGDTVIDEVGEEYATIGVKPTETSKVWIVYGRRPEIANHLTDLIDVEKAIPEQTPTGGIAYAFSIVYPGMKGAIEPTGATREWTNGRDHFTVTHRIIFETPLPVASDYFASFEGKRYRLLELSPEQLGMFQVWEATEFRG